MPFRLLPRLLAALFLAGMPAALHAAPAESANERELRQRFDQRKRDVPAETLSINPKGQYKINGATGVVAFTFVPAP